MIAVIGAANKTPIMPHRIPQNIKESIIVTGWSFKAEPMSLGSRKSPTIILINVGIDIIKIIGSGFVYWINATGIGKITAITAPKTGIKVKKKVKKYDFDYKKWEKEQNLKKLQKKKK